MNEVAPELLTNTGEGFIIPPRVPEDDGLSPIQETLEPAAVSVRESLVDRFRKANILAYIASDPIQVEWAEEEADELRTLLSRLSSK